MPWLLLAAAVAPALFMLHFVYVRDKYEREPAGRILLIYFLGMLTVIPAATFESLFPLDLGLGLFGIGVTSWLVIAFSEELVKYWVLRHVALPHPSFNEVYDGILYGVAASLGFATTENIFYVLSPELGGWDTAIARAVLSVPGHALWGVMMGYFVGRAHFAASRRSKVAFLRVGLLLAVFMHGLYDFFAFGTEVVEGELAAAFMLGVPLVIVVCWGIALTLVRRAQHESVFKRPSPMVNPLAAISHAVKYCHKCGHRSPHAAEACSACGYRWPLLRSGSDNGR